MAVLTTLQGKYYNRCSMLDSHAEVYIMLVSFGVIIMDMFPSEQGVGLAAVTHFTPVPGGAAANVAVAAQRLGVQTAFMGKVGDEQFGRHLHHVLHQEGIDTRGMVFDAYARTTLNFHAIRPDGSIEHLFYRNPGADTALAPADLHTEILDNACVFHFDSLNLTDEPCKSAVDVAIHRARAAGALISFDVNYRDVLWRDIADAKDIVLEYAAKADIVKLNEPEVQLFLGGPAGVEGLLDAGAKLILVTLGEKEVYYQTKHVSGTQAGFPVEPFDTIGCGDSFMAGFLACIIKENQLTGNFDAADIVRYCRTASAGASITATRPGCIPAMPTITEVQTFLEKHGHTL